MIKIAQFMIVFIDLSFICIMLYALPFVVIEFFQQLYIRIRCKYRGIGKKPGRACVICGYQENCDRAWKSEEYMQYFFSRRSHPDQAKKLFDEIQAEEEAKSKPK